ncbi:MAG: hypothetical protein HIU88_10950 [Acidobacteria bacterium]|nr:hypothetical protein [Acidobacteriota bacterium]
MQLVPVIATWFPSAGESFTLLRSAPSQIIVDLLLLASCVILAFGYRGEEGIVGPSVPGRVGLLLLGLASPVQILLSYLTSTLNTGGSSWAFWVGTALGLLPMAATTIAAVAVIRAHVLAGFTRWILLGVAAAEVVQFALSAVQNASQDYYIAVGFYLAAVPPLLLLSAGVSFTLHGRSDSIRQRLHTIHATWRATT